MKTSPLPFSRLPRQPGPRRSTRLLIVGLLVALGAGLTASRYLSSPVGGLPPWRGPQVASAQVGFAWPEYPARLAIPRQDLGAVARGLRVARPVDATRRPSSGGPGPHWAFWTLDWQDSSGKTHRVWIAPGGRFFDSETGPWARTEPLWQAVRPALRRLGERTFGDPLPWREVNRLWPWDSVAVLEDLETGRRLRVARYGGYQHADAEPLTPADTAVLRALYGGQWSWRRRAMVLVVGQRRIAVSINGMPHGGQVIGGNRFDGHFCIHTRQATTHASDQEDPGHQLMVLKSSGRLVWALRDAPPHQVAAWILIALANGDAATAAHMVTDPRSPQWERLAVRLVRHLQFVQVQEAETVSPAPDGAPGSREARVRLDVMLYDTGGAARRHLQWRLVRQDGFWTVPTGLLSSVLPEAEEEANVDQGPRPVRWPAAPFPVQQAMARPGPGDC